MTGCSLTIGLAPFVPKAGTPFQRRTMLSAKTLKNCMWTTLEPLKKIPRVEIETESPRSSILQGVLSQSGREITGHLMETAVSRGPLLASWDMAVRETGDNPNELIFTARDTEQVLPWSFIERPNLGTGHG